jgi:hypothetical protein
MHEKLLGFDNIHINKNIFLYFWNFREKQVFLIPNPYLTVQIYNSILNETVGKTHEWPINNFKMVPEFFKII